MSRTGLGGSFVRRFFGVRGRALRGWGGHSIGARHKGRENKADKVSLTEL